MARSSGGRRSSSLRFLAEPVVALEIVQPDIVLVHPLAGRDVRLRKPDDLSELADGLAFPDRLDRHLVAAQDALARRQAGGGGPLRDEIDGDDDVVVVVETDRARCCGHDWLIDSDGSRASSSRIATALSGAGRQFN